MEKQANPGGKFSIRDVGMEAYDRLQEALANTDPQYWKTLCATRAETHPERSGSYFKKFGAEDVDRFVRGLAFLPYQHTAVKAPAEAYIVQIDGCSFGRMNVVHMSQVPTDATLSLEDPKDTGKVEAVWENEAGGIDVDFMVMLIGPHPKTEKLIVYSFFPGDPVAPSLIPRKVTIYDPMQTVIDRHGTQLRADFAQELGVEWVKVKPIR